MQKFISSLDLTHLSKGAVVRGILMIVLLINYILMALGKNPINIDENTLGTIVTIVLTVGTFVASYWKNNSFTKAAQAADEKLKELKGSDS